MFDSTNAASRRAPHQPEAAGENARPEALEPREPPAQDHDDPADSWRSNLWFGLGAIAFIVPLFIPGIPHRVLLGVYLGIGAMLMIVPLVWGVVRSCLDALHARRDRPRRGWLG